MAAKKEMPTYADLQWPTLEALKDAGGSASIQELSERVSGHLELQDGVSDILHGGGPQTEIDYRLAWARTELRWIGAVDNTARGVWTITPTGRAIPSETKLRDLVRRERRRRQDRVKPVSPKESENGGWEHDLLSVLRDLEPDAFERLCQRVLRESGFTKVEVTGRSGDGGIDGSGVLRVNLISFHVRFQCKRYAGSVSAGAIRDFRGAMAGRADKGLVMTTGQFTRDAKREAVRDGAPTIDLLDGVDLCRLLKKLKLGVSTEMVESTLLHEEFFVEL